MSEMVERLVDAIARGRDLNPANISQSVRRLWGRDVCAVLQAMREPTEAMDDSGSCDGDHPFAGEVWQAMIDATLEDEPHG